MKLCSSNRAVGFPCLSSNPKLLSSFPKTVSALGMQKQNEQQCQPWKLPGSSCSKQSPPVQILQDGLSIVTGGCEYMQLEGHQKY